MDTEGNATHAKLLAIILAWEEKLYDEMKVSFRVYQLQLLTLTLTIFIYNLHECSTFTCIISKFPICSFKLCPSACIFLDGFFCHNTHDIQKYSGLFPKILISYQDTCSGFDIVFTGARRQGVMRAPDIVAMDARRIEPPRGQVGRGEAPVRGTRGA